MITVSQSFTLIRPYLSERFHYLSEDFR